MSLKFAFNVQWIVSINALPTFSMHLSMGMKLACNLPPLEWMNVSTENWSHWQYSGRKKSLLLENWQKFLKKCPHQELVSKSVEISSKFGEIWQEIVTKYSFLFLLKPKIWNSAPHPLQTKVWMEPNEWLLCFLFLHFVLFLSNMINLQSIYEGR